MKTKQDIYESRPTSPHLGIYRPQISSVLSIFHRISGVVLFGSLSILTWIFILHVFGIVDLDFILSKSCICMMKIIACCVSFFIFYHASTGLRHLIWDAGYCLSKKALHVTGWCAISSAIIFSILFWNFVL